MHKQSQPTWKICLHTHNQPQATSKTAPTTTTTTKQTQNHNPNQKQKLKHNHPADLCTQNTHNHNQRRTKWLSVERCLGAWPLMDQLVRCKKIFHRKKGERLFVVDCFYGF